MVSQGTSHFFCIVSGLVMCNPETHREADFGPGPRRGDPDSHRTTLCVCLAQGYLP